MSYIDEWDDYRSPSYKAVENDIKRIESQIKGLQKIRRELRQRKQKVCPHLNLIRSSRMPKIAPYYVTSSPISNVTIKVITKCKDCGKVLK